MSIDNVRAWLRDLPQDLKGISYAKWNAVPGYPDVSVLKSVGLIDINYYISGLNFHINRMNEDEAANVLSDFLVKHTLEYL